jgi:hypothetical protein
MANTNDYSGDHIPSRETTAETERTNEPERTSTTPVMNEESTDQSYHFQQSGPTTSNTTPSAVGTNSSATTNEAVVDCDAARALLIKEARTRYYRNPANWAHITNEQVEECRSAFNQIQVDWVNWDIEERKVRFHFMA